MLQTNDSDLPENRHFRAELNTAMRALSLLLLFSGSASFCVLRQECSPGAPGCLPRGTTPAERAPFPLNAGGGAPVACPQYAASGCCTPAGNGQLFLSLLLAQQTVGESATGGCPACYANVAALWCAFACAPTQSDFLAVLGPANVTNNATGKRQLVLDTDVTLAPAFAGALFTSCAGVGFVRGNALLDTLPAFLAYMGGGQAEAAAAARVNFRVAAAPGALDLPAFNCCSYPENATDPGGSGMATCPCASCLGMCPGGNCSAAKRHGEL